MGPPTRAGGIAIAVLAVGLALSGCGSDKKTEPSSSSSSASSSAPPTSAQASGANETIASYIKKNNINEAAVTRGEAGAPTVDLPLPDGWGDAGAKKPASAYGAIAYKGNAPALTSHPPLIVAIMSKLSDNADPAKILAYAPGEVKNLPQFEGGDGDKDKLGGFDAFKIAGTYVKDGEKLFVAQKTVVIPGPNGLFVLQLNARGPEEGTNVLLDAMKVIDEKTTITP